MRHVLVTGTGKKKVCFCPFTDNPAECVQYAGETVYSMRSVEHDDAFSAFIIWVDRNLATAGKPRLFKAPFNYAFIKIRENAFD